jgi:hypothetical protein
MSFVATLVTALTVFSARVKVRDRKDETIALLSEELAAERQYIKVLRESLQDANAEIARLLNASHACQHQGQLNRAMAQGQWLQPGACRLPIPDCNMHQAEMQQAAMRDAMVYRQGWLQQR